MKNLGGADSPSGPDFDPDGSEDEIFVNKNPETLSYEIAEARAVGARITNVQNASHNELASVFNQGEVK